jgi:hypothetical protein
MAGKLLALWLLAWCASAQYFPPGGSSSGGASAAGSLHAVQTSDGNGGLRTDGCSIDTGVLNCDAFTSSGPFSMSGAEQALSGVSSTSGNAVCVFDTAHGGLACKANGSATVYKLFPQTAIDAKASIVASGTLTLAKNSIASEGCQTVTAGSVNSAAATGVLSTDVVIVTANGSIKAVTGFAPLKAGGLEVNIYPTSGYINADTCNRSADAITPGDVVLNWLVIR